MNPYGNLWVADSLSCLETRAFYVGEWSRRSVSGESISKLLIISSHKDINVPWRSLLSTRVNIEYNEGKEIEQLV
jgi:hypothetical protein